MLAWLFAIWTWLLSLFQGTPKPVTNNQTQQQETASSEEDDSQVVRRSSRMTQRTNIRNRNTVQFVQRVGDNENSDDEQQQDDDDDQIDEDDIDAPRVKLDRAGRIAQKKAQKKALKQQKKEYDEQVRMERERKEQEREKREAEIEAKRDEEERLRQEEIKKIKDEEQKKKQQEYDEWRHMFSVDEAGENVQADLSGGSLLEQFITFVKQSKVVVLEDLASHFQIKTEQAIERLQQLEQEGIITGLFDDRGKFIYLTEQELISVAKFIEQRGRVAIRELVQESNKLIQLKSNTASTENAEQILTE